MIINLIVFGAAIIALVAGWETLKLALSCSEEDDDDNN